MHSGSIVRERAGLQWIAVLSEEEFVEDVHTVIDRKRRIGLIGSNENG